MWGLLTLFALMVTAFVIWKPWRENLHQNPPPLGSWALLLMVALFSYLDGQAGAALP